MGPKPAAAACLLAYTELSAGGADFLDEGPTGWKISAAGCRPAAPDQPYECVLEG